MSDGTRDIYAAEALLEAGNFDAAIKTAKEVLVAQPGDVAALTLIASAYLSKNDVKEAKSVAAELTAIMPEYDFGHRTMAVCLLNQKKKRDAHTAAEMAVTCDPMEPANHVVLALILEEITKFEEAEHAFLRALDIAPDYTFAKSSYAEFLLTRGRTEEAAVLVDDVSREAPGDMTVILVRAKQALLAGNVEEARHNVLWALQQDATDYDAIRVLVQIKMRTNPILGLWWRYAVWIERFTNWQRWMFVIALYVAWRFFYASIVSVLGPAAIPFVLVWVVFCVLTWIGPWLLSRMVDRELKAVRIKSF